MFAEFGVKVNAREIGVNFFVGDNRMLSVILRFKLVF